jgi:hypothetical protein
MPEILLRSLKNFTRPQRIIRLWHTLNCLLMLPVNALFSPFSYHRFPLKILHDELHVDTTRTEELLYSVAILNCNFYFVPCK